MSAYWSRMSSLRNWPGSGSCWFDGTLIALEGEGAGVHGLAVVSWSCRRWLQAIVMFVPEIDSRCCEATSHGREHWIPGRFSCSALVVSTSEDREWISSA